MSALEKRLAAKGHTILRDLSSELDVILIASSKWHHQTCSYSVDDIEAYARLHPRTCVVHRINSCDDQRGADLGINRAMLSANRLADYTVFVSRFMRNYFAGRGFNLSQPHSVILNGADEEIFNPVGRAIWTPGQRMKIATHHWSSNFMKGFDIYERLDQMLAQSPWKEQFDFTFIGNIPLGVAFRNTRVIPPLFGVELARTLKEHHVYITAARHEPAGSHYIEAMRCGLPVLHLDSGALPEYCAPYGVAFTLVDFEQRLLEIRDRYMELSAKTPDCPYTATNMAAEYEALFLRLAEDRRCNPRPSPDIKTKCLCRIRLAMRKFLR